MNSKYSKFLTIFLIIIIIAIIAIIGFLGYRYYDTYILKNNSEDFVDAFIGDTENSSNTNKGNKQEQNNDNNKEDSNQTDENIFDGIEEGTNTSGSSGSATVKKFNGFVISGTIEIPAIKLKTPVIAQAEYSPKALETSVVEIYGPGLNQKGITTIVGHNYRNGTFFSNNKKLNVGDKIYITDLTGKRLPYTIYEKFEAEDNYADYMTKETDGKIEIAISTCTDDSKARLIILARADV